MREAFQALSGSVEAQPLISQWETAFTGLSSLLAAATPTPTAIDARDDIDMQPDKDRAISTEARAFERSLEGLPEEEREAKKQKFVELRRAREASLATSSATSTRPTALAACKRPQARVQTLHPLPRFWLEKDLQFAGLIRKQPGQSPRPTSKRGNLDS